MYCLFLCPKLLLTIQCSVQNANNIALCFVSSLLLGYHKKSLQCSSHLSKLSYEADMFCLSAFFKIVKMDLDVLSLLRSKITKRPAYVLSPCSSNILISNT